MAIYDDIKKHLESSPRARERSNKNAFIGWLMDKEYHLTLGGLGKGGLANLVKDVLAHDRAWRQVLQHEEGLRGKDYDQKEIVEQEAELELGYMSGYNQDIKK